ncbi:MAG: type I glutamate--ammonia ligase [Planctomycetota bacterium]|jgi:glutamine synthetase
MTPADVLAMAREKNAVVVDIRFVDLLGTWQHFSLPIQALDEDVFEEGLGFDGSSIRGWKTIDQSDMLVLPDPTTAWIDPFLREPTLVVNCNIADCVTREDYSRDPRNVARRAEAYLKSTGIADTAYFGPEAEFFLFDDVVYDSGTNFAHYQVDSREGHWNTGRDEPGGNLGYKLPAKGGYFPCPPNDQLQDVRTEMVLKMIEAGLHVEAQHHEVATGGQCEIDLRFAPLLGMADDIVKYKYIVKNVARQAGLTATFMPKPLFADNGSGMHCHLSLWKDEKNLFFGDNYAGLSQEALWAIGGVLRHAPALLAFTNPTTNSYKRLVPGYEAPVNLAYSSRNRSASIRIPTYSPSEKAKRFEFRCPDPTANPYFAFSALMMAALDGIQNKVDPGKPMDKNIYDLPPEILKEIPSTPAHLSGALDALERDHDFLLRGDVFSTDLVEAWIDYKRGEVMEIDVRPHPHEFAMYFDV